MFPYLMSKLTYLKYFEIFKMAANLRFGRTFKPEVLPEVDDAMKIGLEEYYVVVF